MALKSANQQGNTLIEFMVAALVGAMALAIVGTVFLSNQKAAAQRSKEIMLFATNEQCDATDERGYSACWF